MMMTPGDDKFVTRRRPSYLEIETKCNKVSMGLFVITSVGFFLRDDDRAISSRKNKRARENVTKIIISSRLTRAQVHHRIIILLQDWTKNVLRTVGKWSTQFNATTGLEVDPHEILLHYLMLLSSIVFIYFFIFIII